MGVARNRMQHLVAFCLSEDVPLQLGVQLARLCQRHLLHYKLFHQRLVLLLQLLNLRQPASRGVSVPLLVCDDMVHDASTDP